MRRVPWAPSLLALALAPKLAAAVVEAFNCTRAGTQPFQLLKATGDDYSLMRLDDGVYVDIFDLDYTDANDINAAAMYTDADGSFYPYAVFDSQLCRFDRYSVHCYDGTMGVDLANAAAIVGGDRRDHFYYSNALGEKEGDGLWYASDLDASHPTFHDLTLPVNSDLFSSTVVDFAPATEDSGSDDIIADGVAGATYVREAASSGARSASHSPRRSSA
ncbi:DNA binding protein [Aureococcus anophagefferens]|nr:DNA binding protein [Aureococcus anophagefferens]